MIGEQIKTGSTGRAPKIEIVVWRGTAEVLGIEQCYRVPAAVVICDRGKHRAVVQLCGNEQEFGRWWEADLVRSREWEDDSGDLVAGEVADNIDRLLKQNENHSRNMARIEMHNRFLAGKYAIADGGV